MTDSMALPFAKAGSTLVSPFLRRARQELGRRRAGDLATSSPASLDAEFGEAITLLLGEPDTLPEQFVTWIKSILSDPPVIFDDPDARDWLRRDDVQALLKRATLAFISEDALEGYVEEGKALYARSSGEADWPAEALILYAVSFLALTVKARTGPEARLLLAAANHRAGRSVAQLSRIEQKIDGLGHGQGSVSPGRWLPLTFGRSRGLAAALLGRKLGPGDVDACPRLAETDSLLAQLDAVGFARLAGVPGAGKSICLLQVAQSLARQGWRTARLDDPSLGLPELEDGDRILHLIDDAHLASDAALMRLEEKCGARVRLLSAHTLSSARAAPAGTVYLDSARAVKTIARALEADYDNTLNEVRRLDDRVGRSMMDEQLDQRMKAALAAEFPWQFCFILSGGWRRAKELCASARSVDADQILAALALRQLATRDTPCSREEAERSLRPFFDSALIERALAWLVNQRLLLSAKDLRCPHQRFGARMVDAIIEGSDNDGRLAVAELLRVTLGDPELPLSGLALVLHELRFGSGPAFGGWSSIVDPAWLEPALERCWRAATPSDIRDAAQFLDQIGGVCRDEAAILAPQLPTIAGWIAQCPPGACYALGSLANSIFNADEALGSTLRAMVAPDVFARALGDGDCYRVGEILSLASSLRVHWTDECRAAFMSGVDPAHLSKLFERWPSETPLSYAGSILIFLITADEAFGLQLAERLLDASLARIAADPVGEFHELSDFLMQGLRVHDVLGVYKGKLAPGKARRAVGRKYAVAFAGAPLGEAISRAPIRDYQTCAMVLSLVHKLVPAAYRRAVAAIDWSAIDKTIGEDWVRGSREASLLLGCAFTVPGAREAARKIVASNLHRIEAMPARIAMMFPDLAVELVDAGRKIGFADHAPLAAFLVGHFAAARPDLLDRLLEDFTIDLAAALSQANPGFLNEKLLTLQVIADTAPAAFARLLDAIDPDGAAIGWARVLKFGGHGHRGTAAKARQSVAFLIEHCHDRTDALGDVARKLRQKYPKASQPKPETMKSPGPYRPLKFED